MGIYKYLREAWKKPATKEFYKQNFVEWRKDPVTLRIPKPTRLDRARSLGYKAKPGIIMIRQRVNRLRRRHAERDFGGRRPKAASRRLDLNKSYRLVAEERAVAKYKNCEVLNSYSVGEDGMYKWFEVILLEKSNPHIKADPKYNWILNVKGRVQRGLTSAGKRSRGLYVKGKGSEHLRPSKRANLNRRGKCPTKK